MSPLSFNAVDRQAHALRAKEIARIEGVAILQLEAFGHKVAAAARIALAALSEMLRPLFSWNPQPKNSGRASHGGTALLH